MLSVNLPSTPFVEIPYGEASHVYVRASSISAIDVVSEGDEEKAYIYVGSNNDPLVTSKENATAIAKNLGFVSVSEL